MTKMKLYYAPPSPYSRKVRVFIEEKKLDSQVDAEIFNPYGADTSRLTSSNPLGKIPTLLLTNGETMYDSSVICEYLNLCNDETDFIGNSEDRIRNLRQNALANGIMDAAFNIVSEKRRDTEHSQHWIMRWLSAIERGVGAIEKDIAEFDSDEINLGKISMASAIGYVDFRLTDNDWRSRNPSVFEWFDEFSKRDSMKNTIHGELPK